MFFDKVLWDHAAFPVYFQGLPANVCIFQGFWASAIFASQSLLYFPAFQRFSPEIVSKKARNLGSESLKHYKNRHSRKYYKTQYIYNNVLGFGAQNGPKSL